MAKDPPSQGWFRRVARAAAEPLERVTRLAGPAPALLQADLATFRLYARHATAVEVMLGPQVVQTYGDLLLLAAGKDVEVARALALGLPDQVARVRPGERHRYLKVLQWTLTWHPEAAVAVSQHLPDLLPELDEATLQRFLDQGIALLATSPQKARSFLGLESAEAREAADTLRPGVALKDVSRVLALYARAHCGEDVRIVADPQGSRRNACTDGHEVHLPERVDAFGDERDFLVYRVGTALAVGYLEAGTFDLVLAGIPGPWPPRKEGESEIQRLFGAFSTPALARDLFQVLEDRRVERFLVASYPGLQRDLARLRREMRPDRPSLAGLGPADQVLEVLSRRAWGVSDVLVGEAPLRNDVRKAADTLDSIAPGATVHDTAQALRESMPLLEALLSRAPVEAQGGIRGPARRGLASALLPFLGAARLAPERRSPRARALDDQALALLEQARREGRSTTLARERGSLEKRDPVAEYEEMDAWLEAFPGPSGGLVETSQRSRPREKVPASLLDGVEPPATGGQRVFTYPEWDPGIDDYRPRWVHLREYVLARGSRRFVDELMTAQRARILSLRKQFEALRPQDITVLKGLPDGDTLDLERVVEAHTARRAGGSPSERLYCRHQRDRRDVAVAFLLDMSSSTNEVVSSGKKRIMEVEKEALVLIAEAVDAIGDSLAIFGYSGFGRHQVAFYVAKDFQDPYDDAVRERIGRMSWKMENRDGAAIRHATRRLGACPARVRLLVLLSDGKPLDCGCDQYFDHLAQEDTRMALSEARKAGIHPFCITVDPLGKDYLKRMYGDTAYTIIDRVEELPQRIPRIYRRLTR